MTIGAQGERALILPLRKVYRASFCLPGAYRGDDASPLRDRSRGPWRMTPQVLSPNFATTARRGDYGLARESMNRSVVPFSFLFSLFFFSLIPFNSRFIPQLSSRALQRRCENRHWRAAVSLDGPMNRCVRPEETVDLCTRSVNYDSHRDCGDRFAVDHVQISVTQREFDLIIDWAFVEIYVFFFFFFLADKEAYRTRNHRFPNFDIRCRS